MTLLVRNEEDIIDANLRYHLNQGVDFVIATDHGSTDGTPQILEAYARAGHLRLMHAAHERLETTQWDVATRMGRLAASEYEADWVINNDADEFWWPVTGTLKDAFAGIPERFGTLAAPRYDFVARPEDGRSVVDRMVVREVSPVVGYKVANRAFRNIIVSAGSGGVSRESRRARVRKDRPIMRVGFEGMVDRKDTSLAMAPRWPVRILHLPISRFSQYESKVKLLIAQERRPLNRQAEKLERVYESGGLRDFYDTQVVVNDAALEASLAKGRLVVDRRLSQFLSSSRDPLTEPLEGLEVEERSDTEVEAELAEVTEDMMISLEMQARQRIAKADRLRNRVGRLKARLAKAEARAQAAKS